MHIPGRTAADVGWTRARPYPAHPWWLYDTARWTLAKHAARPPVYANAISVAPAPESLFVMFRRLQHAAAAARVRIVHSVRVSVEAASEKSFWRAGM